MKAPWASSAAVLLCTAAMVRNATALNVPARGPVDPRIRVALYDANDVYELRGVVGYQIDLEFEAGEIFTGLGAGDIEALSFVGQDNHLFIKPKAAKVATNLTVLTSRRQYQFDYMVRTAPAGSDEVIYALRFTYARSAAEQAADATEQRLERQLADLSGPRNVDYWYCGHADLKPVAASDDGVHTRLTFSAHADLPAIFVRNDDGSESLLNFSMDAGDMIVHRVARRFIVRRGKLTGCIVNQGYGGAGGRLDSGTVTPEVERRVQGVKP